MAAGRDVPEHTLHLIDGVRRAASGSTSCSANTPRAGSSPACRSSIRAILRTAVFELLDGVPAAIAINEAIEEAESLSTEASGRFVNGVLGAVARTLAEGATAT